MAVERRAPELTAETKAIVQALRHARKVSGAELLQLLQHNADACEERAMALDGLAQELRRLLDEATEIQQLTSQRKWSGGAGEDSDSEAEAVAPQLDGLAMISETLSSLHSSLAMAGLGLWAAEEPSPPAAAAASPRPSEGGAVSSAASPRAEESLLAEVDATLRELARLERGPRALVRRGSSYLPEVDKLVIRLSRLRSFWPPIREAIAKARDSAEPMAVATVIWALQEALSWRRITNAACRDLSKACAQLEDSLDWALTRHEEHLRWRQLSVAALAGLEPFALAQATAQLWLRGAPGGEVGSPRAGAEAFACGLAAAAAVELQLVKCAGTVMRHEPDIEVVQRAVQRFGRLRSRLAVAAGEAERGQRHLAGADESSMDDEGNQGAARSAAVLLRLLQAVDRAAKPLQGPPELDLDGYLSDGSRLRRWGSGPRPPLLLRSGAAHRGEPPAEDVDELRRWLRAVFVRSRGERPGRPSSSGGQRPAGSPDRASQPSDGD